MRMVARGALAWLIAGSFRTRRPAGAQLYDAPAAEARLASWSVSPATDSIGVWFKEAPSLELRDWLVALRRGGTHVAWADSGIAATMIELEPLVDPAGNQVARIAGPRGSSIVLSDELGLLDSLRMSLPGATVRLTPVSGYAS
ncbi:MAG: hypothetical protein ABI613_02770, partial [Gemmatimonadota bacterium]